MFPEGVRNGIATSAAAVPTSARAAAASRNTRMGGAYGLARITRNGDENAEGRAAAARRPARSGRPPPPPLPRPRRAGDLRRGARPPLRRAEDARGGAPGPDHARFADPAGRRPAE